MSLRDKLAKLDDAFLFSLGSVGVLISLIQLSLEGPKGLLEISPFFLLGIVIPFIVGYLKGVIEKDSVQERARGWIYLIIGTWSYFAFFLSVRIIIFPPYDFALFLLPSFLVTYAFLKWLQGIFRIGNRIIDQYAFSGTILCAIIVTFCFRMLVSMYYDLEGTKWPIPISTWPFLMFFVSIMLASVSFILIFEKASSNILESRADLLTTTRARRFHDYLAGRNIFFKGIALGFQLLEHSSSVSPKAQFFWLEGFGFWVIGSLLIKAPILPLIFLSLSIAFIITGAVIFYKISQIDFSSLTSTLFYTTLCLMVIAAYIVVVVL